MRGAGSWSAKAKSLQGGLEDWSLSGTKGLWGYGLVCKGSR